MAESSTNLNPTDTALAQTLNRGRGSKISYVSQTAEPLFDNAVADPGLVIDSTIQAFLRSTTIPIPTLLSVYFHMQFSDAILGTISDQQTTAFRAAILSAAFAARTVNNATELAATAAPLAQQYGLSEADVMSILVAAIDKIATTFTNESARQLAAASITGPRNSIVDFEQQLAVPFISVQDALRARTLLLEVSTMISVTTEPNTVLHALQTSASDIAAFAKLYALVDYNIDYAIPRTLQPVGALVNDVRRTKAGWLPGIKVPTRVLRTSSPSKDKKSAQLPSQFKYYSLDPIAAGRITVADLMTGLHVLDTQLFAVPATDVDFTRYVEDSVMRTEAAFSPRPPVLGVSPYDADGPLSDFFKLFVGALAFSSTTSPLEAVVTSGFSTYKLTADTAPAIQTLKKCIKALAIIAEAPLHAMNLFRDVLSGYADLRLQSGDTPLPEFSVERWLNMRNIGLSPLRENVPGITTAGYFHSVSLADGLPNSLPIVRPRTALIVVDPIAQRDGDRVTATIPATRTYGDKVVYLTNSQTVAPAHAPAIARLLPSNVRHTAVFFETVPLVTEPDIAKLISHIHVDNVREVAKSEPIEVRAMAAHLNATTRDYTSFDTFDLSAALTLGVASYVNQEVRKLPARFNAPFSGENTPPVVLSGLPAIQPGHYAVTDEEYVILHTASEPFFHEDSILKGHTTVSTKPSAAPLVAAVSLPFSGSVSLNVKTILDLVKTKSAPSIGAKEKKKISEPAQTDSANDTDAEI